MRDTDGKTTVQHSTAQHVALWAVLPTAGALLGFALSRAPSWTAKLEWFPTLPWLPDKDTIAELADTFGFKVTVALTIAGLLVGCFLALMTYDEIVSVTIDENSVTIKRGDKETAFAATEVKYAFVDNGHLVMLKPSSEELVREETDLARDALQNGFASHGYTWCEHDPYADYFTRWVDGMSGLSQDANAILRARQIALDIEDLADQRELRTELARHHFVVRDDGKRQYWRPITVADPDTLPHSNSAD